jgi:predicted transcriptional regulator
MKQQHPCEYMIWYGVPFIKKEITKCLINNFGLNQRETAKLLGITPASVCMYISEKRGKIAIKDEKIKIEINISAERIVKHGETVFIPEICRICKILREKKSFNIIEPKSL